MQRDRSIALEHDFGELQGAELIEAIVAASQRVLPEAQVLPIGTSARVGGTHPTGVSVEGMEGFDAARLEAAQTINYEDWRREVLMQDELFFKLYSHLPKELIFQRELLVARL